MKKLITKLNIKHILSWLFVIFLSVTFIAFFTFEGGSITPREQNVVGTIDSYKIINVRRSVFQDYYRRRSEYYSQAGGGSVSADLDASIRRAAFDDTVRQHLLLAEADKAHVYVSDAELITGVRELYGEESFLSIVKSSDAALKQQIETNVHYALRAEKLRSTLFYHVPVTRSEVELYQKAANIQKQIFVAQLDFGEELFARAKDDTVLFDYFMAKRERYEDDLAPAAAETAVDEAGVAPQFVETADAEAVSGTEGVVNTELAAEVDVDESSAELLVEPAAPTNTTAASDIAAATAEDALNTLFKEKRDEISGDYIIENTQTLREELHIDYLEKLKTVVENVKASTAPRNVFTDATAELGMELLVSDYFSYFETEIPISTGSVESVTLPEDFHRQLFTGSRDETVLVYGEPNDTQIYAILVLDTIGLTTDAELQVDEAEDNDFIAKRYEEKLKEDTRTRFADAYYAYLKSFAEIYYNDQLLE